MRYYFLFYYIEIFIHIKTKTRGEWDPLLVTHDLYYCDVKLIERKNWIDFPSHCFVLLSDGYCGKFILKTGFSLILKQWGRSFGLSFIRSVSVNTKTIKVIDFYVLNVNNVYCWLSLYQYQLGNCFHNWPAGIKELKIFINWIWFCRISCEMLFTITDCSNC